MSLAQNRHGRRGRSRILWTNVLVRHRDLISALLHEGFITERRNPPKNHP